MMVLRSLALMLVLVLVLAGTQGTATQRLEGMEFKDAPLSDVFQILGEIAGMNVLVDPSVTGEVSFYLKDLTVDEALDLVAKTTGFHYRVVGSTMIVATPQRLEEEFSTEEFAFIGLNHVSVESARDLLRAVAPNLNSFADREQRLLILHGRSHDIEFAKQILQQYDRRQSAAPAPAAEEDVDRGPVLNRRAISIQYVAGQDILRAVRQLYPERDFAWDGELGLLTGTTTEDEWQSVEAVVAERDLPAFILRGVTSGSDRVLVLVEYDGSTSLLEEGDMLAGWTVLEIAANRARFGQDDREFTVALGR